MPKQQRRKRHELNKSLKEQRYAATFPLFQPTNYEIIFINRTTSIETLTNIIQQSNRTKIVTFDTESINRQHQSNMPALIQIQLCFEITSIVLIVEIHHLPNKFKPEFDLIRTLFSSLFTHEKTIFLWGDPQEIFSFAQFDLFNHSQIFNCKYRNIQVEFRYYWEQKYIHNSLTDSPCRCKKCFGVLHNNSISLQDAIAFEFSQYLNKTFTRKDFSIGLDENLYLASTSTKDRQHRRDLTLYAANDCDAIRQIIIQLNLINNSYNEPIQYDNPKSYFEFILDDKYDDLMLDDTMQTEEIVIEKKEIIIHTINQTSSTTNTNTHDRLISSVKECRTLEIEPHVDVKQVEVGLAANTVPKARLVTVELAEETTTHEPQIFEAQTFELKPINPKSQEERKKIHNRSRSYYQRIRCYRTECIIHGIDIRFPIRLIKKILLEHNVLVTRVQPNQSKYSNETFVYVGLKEPISLDKYHEIEHLFNTDHYNKIFFKNRHHRLKYQTTDHHQHRNHRQHHRHYQHQNPHTQRHQRNLRRER